MSLETTFRMYWRDERIEIRNDSLPDSHKHPNKTFIPLHPDVAKMIWVPDIFIDQAVALRKPTLHTAPTSIRMYKDGLIRYSTRSENFLIFRIITFPFFIWTFCL